MGILGDTPPTVEPLPPTAICPGCLGTVALPVDPPQSGWEPTFCPDCGTEIPDIRRTLGHSEPVLPVPEPFPAALESRRFSRGGLFRSLGGLIADRGLEAVKTFESELRIDEP
jgi:hypothetical protein